MIYVSRLPYLGTQTSSGIGVKVKTWSHWTNLFQCGWKKEHSNSATTSNPQNYATNASFHSYSNKWESFIQF